MNKIFTVALSSLVLAVGMTSIAFQIASATDTSSGHDHEVLNKNKFHINDGGMTNNDGSHANGGCVFNSNNLDVKGGAVCHSNSH